MTFLCDCIARKPLIIVVSKSYLIRIINTIYRVHPQSTLFTETVCVLLIATRIDDLFLRVAFSERSETNTRLLYHDFQSIISFISRSGINFYAAHKWRYGRDILFTNTKYLWANRKQRASIILSLHTMDFWFTACPISAVLYGTKRSSNHLEFRDDFIYPRAFVRISFWRRNLC